MGSLMAGWSSRVLDNPDTVLEKRNKSMTKEEIESFRRLYRQDEQELEFQAPENNSDSMITSPRELKKSSGWQQLREVRNLSQAAEGDHELITNTGDWWTRSNWAFLNEPPRDEVNNSAHKYSAQFHVAQIATGNQ